MEFRSVCSQVAGCWSSAPYGKVRRFIEEKKKSNDCVVVCGAGMIVLFLLWGVWAAVVRPMKLELSTIDVRSMPAIVSSNSYLFLGEEHKEDSPHNITATNEREVSDEVVAKDERSDEEKNSNGTSQDMVRMADTSLPPYYSLGKPIIDWDRQRKLWLEKHPEFLDHVYKLPNLLLVTGSQPHPCKHPIGDHYLLRTFKNKVDYCRLHGLEIFYNVALLDPSMDSFWSKLPLVRAAMLAHPEVEWIWWLDSDAIITDMEFEIPLIKYTSHHMVVHGWENLIYENRSWVGLNAGSFVVRNCQWTLHFLERWASMGPLGPIRTASGKIQSDLLPDRPKDWPGDDQSALIYLLIKERDLWADKIFIENSYYLHGYWLEIIDNYDTIEKLYQRLTEEHQYLSQREAERRYKVAAGRYAKIKNSLLNISMHERRPFVTHFTGCQPCSGMHNSMYDENRCREGMERALNFADNQVLLSYGFNHHSLESAQVKPLD
eukprot:c14295_g1_i1 orf=1045-2511(+)